MAKRGQPRGSEKFGLASKVIVHDLMNSHTKFQRLFIILTIVVIIDIGMCDKSKLIIEVNL